MPTKGASARRLSPLQILVILAFFVGGFWLGSPVPVRLGGGAAAPARFLRGTHGEHKAAPDQAPPGEEAAVARQQQQQQQQQKAVREKAPDAEHVMDQVRLESIRDDHQAGVQNLQAEAEHRVVMQRGDVAGRGLQCPEVEGEVDGGQIPLAHLPRKKPTSVAQKYDRRAHNCASHGIWNRVTIDDHHKILHNVVRLAGIKRDEFVLDWGSGCGHSMQFLYDEFNVTGVGIDVSSKTVAYARENTTRANLHCVADGTKLSWIPDGFFDHAFSFGSIYHVYNRTIFCHVLRQLVRIVRVGGTVYNGWTENAEFKRVHLQPCLEDLAVKFEVLEEHTEFANVRIFPLKSQQRTPNTYSLVIRKAGPISADQVTVENIPIVCGKHKCVKKDSPEASESLP